MSDIQLRDVSFTYEDGLDDALNNINLNIQDGEFLCVIGASGCGKSTLLRILAGLETPESGSITIDGKAMEAPCADRMIVFQDYALFPWMSARRNVSFAVKHAKKLSGAESNAVADSFLERVGMSGHGSLYPCQLSGGMKQRVAIARALAMDTDILLLDEPFGALDTKTRTQLQALLLELWQNAEGLRKTVIFVTHDISEAVLLADRVIFMEPGRIARDIDVPLPRPRTDKKKLTEYEKTLHDLFYHDAPEGTAYES